MKNKKLFLMAGALVLGAGSLVSCGGSSKAFKVWCASEDVPYLKKVIENFKADEANAKWKDTKIEVVITNEPDAATNLKSDPNASADVFHFAGDQIGTLVRQGLLYEIPSAVLNGIGIDSAVLDAGKVAGKQYGIPFTPNTFFLYYDADVYSAEEVKKFDTMVAKDISESGYKYNFALDIANGWYLQSYFFSAGCTIFGEDGLQPAEGIKPADKALQVAEWVWNYYNGANKAKLMAGGDGPANMGLTVAACVSGTWDAARIKTAVEANGGTYAAAPLPKLTIGGTDYEWTSVGDYKQVGVNKVTKDPELACSLAAYIANKDSQALRYEMRQTAPTNAATASDPSIQWDKSIVAQTEQLKHTFAQPTIYADQGFWDASTALGDDLRQASKVEISDYFDAFLNTITKVSE